jgi:hypothetical protein
MNRTGLIILILLMSFVVVRGQERLTRAEYIELYSDLAMKEMQRTGIPASIKLAQACLESDNGNSRLAREGRNHFGIKCHDWTGRRIHHDDDEKNECFRNYKTVYQSYIDHSEFLTGKTRYAELFTLKPDDYIGWSRGLKRAGYATSPSYADLLIKIIEENELYKFDQMVLSGERIPSPYEDYSEERLSRTIYTNNRVEFVVAGRGDTPGSLRDEMDLYPREIYRYNDIERGAQLDSGMVIYLQPKRFRAAKGNDFHVVNEGETMWDISQKYAVKLNRLYRMNNLETGSTIEPGTKVWLRKRKPMEPDSGIIEDELPEAPVEMEFKFDPS